MLLFSFCRHNEEQGYKINDVLLNRTVKIFLYLLTNAESGGSHLLLVRMERPIIYDYSLEADTCSAGQDSPPQFINLKFHYPFKKNP